MEMVHFKKYSSFSEKRYALKWQISVQPLHNIIITNWEQKLERRLFSLETLQITLKSR